MQSDSVTLQSDSVGVGVGVGVFVQLTLVLCPCETRAMYVLFDPAFRDDRYIRIASDAVTVSYHEHGHVVSCWRLLNCRIDTTYRNMSSKVPQDFQVNILVLQELNLFYRLDALPAAQPTVSKH